MNQNKKAILTVLAIYLILVIFLFSFRRQILGGLAEFLIDEDPIRKCDAAFILGGEFPNRAIEAGDLYLQGYVQNIINVDQIEGPGYEMIKKRKLPIMEPLQMTGQLLRSMGVPSSSIMALQEKTDRTIQEAKALKDFLVTRDDISCITVVTSKFHLKRAKKIFQKVFKRKNHRFVFHAPGFDDYSPDDWWKKPRYVRNTVNEYLKLFVFELGIY